MADGNEVEMKFRIRQEPEEFEGKLVNQGYLDFKKDETVQATIKEVFGDIDLTGIKEARVRQKGEGEHVEYFFTLKGDGTLVRPEEEMGIDEELFSQLWQITNLGKIFKERMDMPLADDLKAEVDRYAENMQGLITVEVEFDLEKYSREEIIEKIQALYPDAEDVTEIKAYKNKELAQTASLEELEAKVAEELRLKQEADAEPGQLPTR